MDLELTGKKAIVTGGSVGIGKATARELAKEGVDVLICARRQDILEQTASELAAETGRKIIPVVADTTSTESVNAMVARAVEELGGVDILVNNAAAPGGFVHRPPRRIGRLRPALRHKHQGRRLLPLRPRPSRPT